jgi:glycosyltransferase involved in cell wall biosynthesis
VNSIPRSGTPDLASLAFSGAEITTVIPTYRRPALLRRAILSATEQIGVQTRVAVFDNCSGDETGEVVAGLMRCHPGVSYHAHGKNLGAMANFEFGVHRIKTPFFSILSDDDYLLPGFYRQAIAALNSHPEAMFWGGTTLNVDERGTIWDARVDRWPREGLFLPPEGVLAMTGGLAPTWTGIVFRREVLELAGFIDHETAGPSDLDYTLRLGVLFPFLIQKTPVAVFTLNPEGFSATQPLSSFWPGWLKMFRNVQLLPGLDAKDRDTLMASLHADARRMLFRRAVNAIAAGRPDYANEVAEVLVLNYGQRSRAMVLRGMVKACTYMPFMQQLMTGTYQALERRIVRSRAHLQAKYGHLLRPA